MLERGDAGVEPLDLAGELPYATGGRLLGDAGAEGDPRQLAQLTLALAVDDSCFALRVDLRPDRAQPLDCLGAVVDGLAPQAFEQRQSADQLGLERGSELLALAQHDVRDRDSVAGVALAPPLFVPVAMRAPGRHVEDLAAGRGECCTQQASITGGVLDPDDRVARVVLGEPAEQALDPGNAVRDRERSEHDPFPSSSAAAWLRLWTSTPTTMVTSSLVSTIASQGP